MKKNSSQKVKASLIDLYLTLRQYSLDIKKIKKEENIEYLTTMDELELINYIKDSLDTVILTLAEKKINDYNNQIYNEHIQQDYEAMLIKYEQDIRGHIKVEHQLKLYSDSLQNNLEELENEKKLGFNNSKKNIEYENEITKLKKEIKNQKKLIKSYEEQNTKLAESEKKLKNLISKNEKKYKNDIDILSKKLRYYIEKLQIYSSDNKNTDKIEKRKSETICYTNSHRPNNSSLIKNFMFENETNNNMNSSLNGGVTRIYRNTGNNILISDNHSTSTANSRPYVKVDKYVLNKYVKNTNKQPYQYLNKVKNMKNASCDYRKDKNINLRNSNLPNSISNIPNNANNSYILDSKAQVDIMNKFMMNDSSSLIKTKRVYNRHKSLENNSNCIKGKHINIKKILMSNNHNHSNSNVNSERNSYKELTKGVYNKSIVNKKLSNNNSNINSVNSEKSYMNKTAKEIDINNIIEGKNNNIRCNFVNNINIYSNNCKQDNSNNIYIGHNSKKYSGNTSFRGIVKNNNLNGNNYVHINGNKSSIVSYRNKQKDGKMISSLTNSIQKKY